MQTITHPQNRANGFTLIELLVVVAIITTLLAILLPSMGRAVATAQIAVCGSNLKQLSTDSLTYAASNFGQLSLLKPLTEPNPYWPYKIARDEAEDIMPGYFERGMFTCPGAEDPWDLQYTNGNGGQTYLMSVQYFANNPYSAWRNHAFVDLPNRKPVFHDRLTDRPASPLLWTDLARHENTAGWLSNHRGATDYSGMNCSAIDCSVQWTAWDEVIQRTSYSNYNLGW